MGTRVTSGDGPIYLPYASTAFPELVHFHRLHTLPVTY